MTRLEYEDSTELENKLYEFMAASNDHQNLNYPDDTIETAAEQLVPLLSSGDHQPTYDDIERWLAEAYDERGDLPGQLKLKATEEYLIGSGP